MESAVQPPETEAPRDSQLEPLEIAEELARVERKPPLYRAFRGTLYTLYLVLAVWLTTAVIVAAWRGVWGDAGAALRHAQNENRPLTVATPPTP